MKIEFKYQSRTISSEEIHFIKEFIRNNPEDSRWKLSRKLCQAWNWIQPNGSLRDMYCRSLMLRLHRHGYIKLPPKKRTPNNPLANRQRPERIEIDQRSIKIKLKEIQPLHFQQVRGTHQEKTYKGLISEYHYLGYCHPIGEHLKYVVYWKQRLIACFGFSSVVRHIKARDQFIGWSKAIREKNLHLIAYNTRYLILPHLAVKHLASHLLSRIVKIVATEWQKYYHHPVYYLETFVDTERFAGICYKAAGWKFLGKTSGRGKNDQSNKVNRSIKSVWAYPLNKNFREVLLTP